MDGNGSISCKNIEEPIKELFELEGYGPPPATLLSILAQRFDQDEDGRVGFTEFRDGVLNCWKQYDTQEQRIKVCPSFKTPLESGDIVFFISDDQTSVDVVFPQADMDQVGKKKGKSQADMDLLEKARQDRVAKNKLTHPDHGHPDVQVPHIFAAKSTTMSSAYSAGHASTNNRSVHQARGGVLGKTGNGQEVDLNGEDQRCGRCASKGQLRDSLEVGEPLRQGSKILAQAQKLSLRLIQCVFEPCLAPPPSHES